MEYELRQHLSINQVPSFGERVNHAITENEDVQSFWSILSADWEEESASVLLQMVVGQWVKIRGFSYASSWMEKYKTTMSGQASISYHNGTPSTALWGKYDMEGGLGPSAQHAPH